MRHYPHRPPCMYAEAAGALADYLAPHQVAVGVPGGLDILVHGVRAYLRAQPELVVVRLDLRNAYNEIDRCAALRRLAAVPELAHLAPLFHVLHAPVARLQLSTGRSLFDGVAGRESDSEEGMRQGSAESSAVFCMGIAPELAALDRELAAVGGARQGARSDADDVYACGPPSWVGLRGGGPLRRVYGARARLGHVPGEAPLLLPQRRPGRLPGAGGTRWVS